MPYVSLLERYAQVQFILDKGTIINWINESHIYILDFISSWMFPLLLNRCKLFKCYPLSKC